ncbi:hypothetical protein BDZ89DRAFT_1076325 [Hymenopellis radicata]|nr:hypothetical protein BDZ89DRAFT_1076325 [Hymenopellis radicata]
MPRTVKVAVIGSGLAGLTAAYLLTNSKDADVEFDVHLFRKGSTSTLGMDSSSISLPIPGKEQTWRVDVPMRSFQGGYYKQVMALYKKLGAVFVERDFSYSFSLLSTSPYSRSIATEMIYNGSSGTKGVSMPSSMRDPYIYNALGLTGKAAANAWTMGVFALWTFQLLLCYLRLLCLSVPFTRPPGIESMTYATWVRDTTPTSLLSRWTGFDIAWANFTRVILIPLFSAVCTAPEKEILEHPVEEMLDYIWLTLGTHHYVVKDGVRDVVSRLLVNVKHVHLSSLISSIEADPDDVDTLSVHCSTAGGVKVHSGFHHVVFATQANRCTRSYRLTRTPFLPIRCLENFTYSSTVVINHTDETLLPDDTRDHRDLNLIYTSDTISPRKGTDSPRCLPPSYTMTTQILPPPKAFPSHLPRVFQTTNPTIEPKEERILSVASLERAVLSLSSKEALHGLYKKEKSNAWWREDKDTLGPLQGGGRLQSGGPGIWICGSYAYPGIPLLEGCAVSARLVVEQGILHSEGVAVKKAPW